MQRFGRLLLTGRIHSLSVLAVLAVTRICVAQAAPPENVAFPQKLEAAAIEGTVRDSAGAPVAGATVLLEEKGSSNKIEAKTNATGAYVLNMDHAGTYTVRAGKTGWIDTVADAIELSLGVKKRVDLVLSPVGSVNSKSAATSTGKDPAGAMEFADEPNFTVAGVTDWSNLGLHGSAASSQTSESLAKETLSLKSGEPDSASRSAAGARYDAALDFKAKGEYSQARDEVRKTLAAANDAEGHHLLGELNEQLGDPLGAVREYQQAVRMDPSEQNYFEWGTELLLHKAAEPAAEVFRIGSKAHPQSARMLTGLGAALYASGSPEEAARHLCEASDLQPSDIAPYLFLGKIEQTTPGPLACSGEKLARFAREQPGNALANYYYAVSLWKQEKGTEDSPGLQRAEALLKKAVSIDPNLGEAYLQLGILHAARKEFGQAIRDYEKTIEVSPNLGEAHRQLGLIYQRTGEQAKAQQEFQAYQQAEKTESAERERQQRELRQFLIVLKDEKTKNAPH